MLDDIDQNARAIEEVISFCERQALDPKNEYQLSVLPSDLSVSPLMDFATTQDSYGKPSLIRIYDRLVNDWLSNLPHDIPGRTRIMKEKVIGRLAADLILARINVTRETPNGPNETLANEQLKYYDDVESSNPESTISTHRVATPRRSSLPVSEKGRDGSIPRSDFAAENSQSFEDGRVPLYSSLLSLTTFNHQPSVPRNIEPVLSHWTPGTDPAAYDWQKTVQSITDDETQRTSSRARTPKHRPRKKTPQATSIMSSPAPPPVSPAPPLGSERGSQPTGGDPRHIQATTMEEDFPMTQVERGAFGGREAARRTAMKTRKKKRAAGF